MVGTLPGVLVGVGLLIFAGESVDFVNAISSLIFAVTLPYAVIGLSLFYRRLRDRQRPVTEEGPTATSTLPAPA